ncbi:tyrosine--tRNA ligase [Phtheirospermum japonicum]|uniref:Tyrosine--tRNA ligase n=1 Tax=Phtheirospermum japonicum TaxID=374723 RepID=A0A830BZI1_9LAMI|nr:tyrosine--tRNA ligase [Phtheirospermum japonicum]
MMVLLSLYCLFGDNKAARRWRATAMLWIHEGILGPSSKNPLSFKWYSADEEILGKKMKDWLRFSVALIGPIHLVPQQRCGHGYCLLTVKQLSDALRRRRPDLPPLRVYGGFDPTAESLHLGNLLGIIILSWFLRCGHRVVALVGGSTGHVGDPSGKSIECPELDPLSLDRNISAISSTIRMILSSSSSSVFILNNYDWWKDVKLLDFLRDVGRFARVRSIIKENKKGKIGK